MLANFEALAQQVKASNEIPTKQLAEWFVGTLAGMYQWLVSQATDLADYSQAIASRVDSDNGMDEDTFNLLTKLNSHLSELNNLFEEMKEILPENVLALGEKNKDLSKELGEFLSSVENSNESDNEDEDEEPLFEDDGDSSEGEQNE
jgi:Rad3-related DNA helicase